MFKWQISSSGVNNETFGKKNIFLGTYVNTEISKDRTVTVK